MKRRVLYSWSLLVPCTFLFMNGCSAFKAAIKYDTQEISAKTQTLIPAGTLTSLEVVADACPVFLEPRKTAPHFGPLIHGEVVKWLDARSNWVRVWIPRLRISGWILQGDIVEILDKDPNQPFIPECELTTMIGVSEKINVREDPTTKSKVILVAFRDEKFFLLGEREGWFRVWLPEQGKTGWVFNKVLERKAEK